MWCNFNKGIRLQSKMLSVNTEQWHYRGEMSDIVKVTRSLTMTRQQDFETNRPVYFIKPKNQIINQGKYNVSYTMSIN